MSFVIIESVKLYGPGLKPICYKINQSITYYVIT